MTNPATVNLTPNDISDMLNLNCWVLGDPLPIFSVKIAKSETVSLISCNIFRCFGLRKYVKYKI